MIIVLFLVFAFYQLIKGNPGLGLLFLFLAFLAAIMY